MDDEMEQRRLKYYGRRDIGSYWQRERLHEVLSFELPLTDPVVNDVIELHQAVCFIEADLIPRDLSEAEVSEWRARVRPLKAQIGRFFQAVDDTNVADILAEVAFDYRADCLGLLAQNKAFTRCGAKQVIDGSRRGRFNVRDLLECSALVKAYDESVRTYLLSHVAFAEEIIAKHLQGVDSIHLPASLSAEDKRAMLAAYIESENPHAGMLELLSKSHVSPAATGVDKKVKLKARRRHAEVIAAYFKDNRGIRTGYAVGIDPDQEEPSKEEFVDDEARYSYSEKWLRDTLDMPSTLNNFHHLFNFATESCILTFPSYLSQIGVLEGLFTTAGKTLYRTGDAFRHRDLVGRLQTVTYERFLRSEGQSIEAALQWFCEEYVRDEYDVQDMSFSPSSATSTHLERNRHLFPEVEALLAQWRLYVEEGEIDTELLSIGSESMVFGDLPSLVEGKYLYVTDAPEAIRLMNLLFSDQSSLCHFGEGMQDSSFVRLVVGHDVGYSDAQEYHRGEIDWLIEQGFVEIVDERLRMANPGRLKVLFDLWTHEAASYHHYGAATRTAIDELVDRGWLTRESSLFTKAETSYLNFMLNNSRYSDGPQLRNKYAHGSVAPANKDEHGSDYFDALRLLAAIVIKLNDDLRLATDGAHLPNSS